MKKRKVKKLSLEKLTIARIDPNAIHSIHGGSSIPTSVQVCPSRYESICEDPD